MSGEIQFPLSIENIKRYLPHRSPFLLVDRILEVHQPNATEAIALSIEGCEAHLGTRVVGLKNVSYNEPFMTGHFPDFAIMPGVLLIEAMAQNACFTLFPQAVRMGIETFKEGFHSILLGVDGVRLRKPVTPGDTLRLESVVTKARGRFWSFQCEAFVEGKKVAEAELLANMFRGQ